MERIWLQSYSPGVPHEIGVDDLGAIGDRFEASVRAYADRVAFISGASGVRITYRELDALSRNVAAWLQSVLRLPQGSRVALMLPNILQFPVCLLGALRAGYVVVNVNPLYTARELAHQLADSGAEAIFILENMAHVLEKAIGQTAVKHVVVTGVGDLLGFPKRHLAHFVVRRVRKMVPPYSLPGAVSFDAMLAQGTAARFEPVKVASEDLAFLQYTGGTTGVSKGAMLSHRNLLANARQAEAWSDPFLDPNDEFILVTAIPLYHIFALASAVSHITRGGCNVLVSDPRNTAAFVKVLAQYRFVSLPAVNTLFNSLIHHPDFARVDFSKLRFAIGGGAAVQRAVAERWQRITGVPLCEGYGLTECSPTVTCNPLHITAYTGSIGLPHAVDRRLDPRRERHGGGAGRSRRAVRARAAGDAGLLESPRRNRPRHDAGRVPAHRRRGDHRRTRIPVHRRPQEGPDPRLRLQRLSQRGGAGGRPASAGAGGGGGRRARRGLRRGGEAVRGQEGPRPDR